MFVLDGFWAKEGVFFTSYLEKKLVVYNMSIINECLVYETVCLLE